MSVLERCLYWRDVCIGEMSVLERCILILALISLLFQSTLTCRTNIWKLCDLSVLFSPTTVWTNDMPVLDLGRDYLMMMSSLIVFP